MFPFSNTVLAYGANAPASHLDDVQSVLAPAFIQGRDALCSLPASPSPSTCAQLPHLGLPGLPSGRALPRLAAPLPFPMPQGAGPAASVRAGGAGQTAGQPQPDSQDTE